MFAGCGKADAGEVNVYNWGEYIAEGQDGLMNVIEEFEKETGIKVNYTTYETNEDLYNMLKNSNVSYDVVVPSDYMISKMIKENMLLELNYDNIPNYQYINDRFKGLDCDPDNKYTVIYQWGVTGLVYDKTKVKNKPTDFSALWDKDLKGKMLMFSNSRDAYAIAMQLCGITPDTFTKADVDKATEKLKEQKPLLKKYVMDQTFNEMERDQSAMAPYYAGDIYTMTTNNDSLVGVLPEEGSNLFVDAMCIPKSAQNVDGALKFINFMTRPEISAANMDSVTYASPVEGAKELMDEEVASSELVYPPESYLDKCYTFKNVDDEVYTYMQEKFIEIMS